MHNTKKGNLKSFSLILFVCGMVVCVLSLFKEYVILTWVGGGIVVAIVVMQPFPKVLRVAFDGWMAFSRVLGWVNTRILLVVFYFVVLTPIALVMRLIGKRPLDLAPFDKSKTAWQDCPPARENHWECMY